MGTEGSQDSKRREGTLINTLIAQKWSFSFRIFLENVV